MKPKSNLFKRVSRFSLVPAFAAISICLGGQAIGATWVNTGTADWNTASNWNPTGVPNGAAASVITNSGFIATITSTPPNPGDIIVGNGTGTNGRVDHTAGTITTGSWMKIGHNSGAGVYNLANTSGTGGTYTSFGTGAGSVNLTGGHLRLGGGDAGSGGSGIMNVNTTGSLTVGGEFHIGTQTSTGVLNFDSGTINLNNNAAYIGNGAVGGSGVTGTLNMSGGTLNKVTGGQFRIGNSGANGFVTVTGGTLNNNGSSELQIGNGAGSHGTLSLGGTGTINTASWVSIGRSTGTGAMNVSGGTFSKTNGGSAFIVGDGSPGTLTQTNGTITTSGEFWISSGTSTGTYTMSGGSVSADNWFVVGRNGGSNGTINMSGGTITKGGANDLVVGADSTTAVGAINFSGGLINVTAGVTNIGKGGGTGTLTMSSTADFRTTQMVVGVGTGVGTVNLDGGTLKTSKLNGGGGSSTVHFNGGTLLATADSTTLVSGLTTADILSGGAIIDTQGFTETAPQVLSGTGTLTKLGSGTLNLTGNSTHTGPTVVSDGKLVVTTRSITTAGDFTVADGKTLGVTRRLGEESLNPANLTFGTTASTATLEMNLGNFGNPVTGGTIRVAGNLTVNATTTININDSFPEVGSFPLIQFGSRSGTGTFTLGTLPPGVVAYLDETIDPNAVYLVITQAKLLEWDDSELSGGVWDTTNSNWNDLLTAAPSVFTSGAPVSFLDLGSVDFTNPPNPNVVIDAAGVSPGTVTFKNSAINYSVSGAGGINGSASLLKQGTGTVTLSTSNSYTGVTRLEAGTLSVSSIANAGSPSGIGAASASAANLVFAGGKLSYTGSGDTSDRGFTISAANSVFDVQGALTMSGAVASSAGQFTKIGAGTLTLSNPGANVLANGVGFPGISINEGSLVLNGSGTQTNSVVSDVFVGAGVATTSDLTLNNTSLTSTAYLATARGSLTPGHASTVTITNSTVTTGNLSLGYSNAVAGYSTTSVLTLNNSSYTNGFSKIGESTGATATVVMNGTSTMTAVNTDVAQSTGAIGTLDVKGSSVYTSNARMQIGRDAGSAGTVVVENSGGIVVNSYVSVGFGGAGTMTVKNNGTLNIANDLSVNENGDAPATLTLQDSGSITVGATTYVGRLATRVGTVTQTGGTYTGNGGEFQIGKAGSGTWLQSAGTTNAGGWVSIGRETGGTGVLTVSGTGTFNQTGAGNALIVGENGTGTLNLQGSATVSVVGSGGLIITRAGGTGTVNLDGGTLVAPRVFEDGGSSAFHFNGGVLKAGIGANLAFMTGLDTVDVKSGGAFIDTNGQTIAIGQSLGDQGGGLTKQGAGTLLLNGVNTYPGTTSVTTGVLGGTGSVAGLLTVPSGTSIAPGASNVGTFTAGASATIGGTYLCEVSGGTSDTLVVANTLDITGATLDFSVVSAPTAAVLILANYGSLTGTFTTVNNLPPGYTLDYNYLNGNQIALVQSVTPYGTWATGHGLDPQTDGAPGADPDGDGQANSIEFALGGDPTSGSDNARIFSLMSDSSADEDAVNELLLTIAVRSGTPAFLGTPSPSATKDGFTYTIEGSTTLGTFMETATPVTVVVPPSPNDTPPTGYEYRTFSLSGSNGLSDKGFLRVKVSN